MSTQKKWKLAQMLCLGVSVFGEAGPAAPWGVAALAGLWGNLACVLAQRRRKGK